MDAVIARGFAKPTRGIFSGPRAGAQGPEKFPREGFANIRAITSICPWCI